MRNLRTRLLAATAVFGGANGAAIVPLLADDYDLHPHQGPVVELGLEGSFLFNDSGASSGTDDGSSKFGDIPDVFTGDQAAAMAVSLRYNIDSAWAVDGAFSATWLEGDEANDPDPLNPLGQGSFDTDYSTIDLGAVYRMGDPGFGASRFDLIFGMRGLFVDSHAEYAGVDVQSSGWYGGPRLGLQASVPLFWHVSLIGSASGSVLFGSRNTDASGFTGPGTSDDGEFGTVYNVEGALGLDVAIVDGVSLQAGYRAQQLWNAGAQYDEIDKAGNYEADDANLLVHGAFVKVNLQF